MVMAVNLFPVFEIPKIIDTETKQENRNRYSAYFDFVKGDFLQDGTGTVLEASPYDAWVQWCLKTANTQRWAFLSYSDNLGVEIEEAFKEHSKAAIESELIKTIDEALLADPYGRTVYVKDFKFDWGVDSVKVTLTIKGIWEQDAVITVEYKN